MVEEPRLLESGPALEMIVERAPECLKVVSASGRLLDMNTAGLRLVEAESRAEVIGRDIAMLVHPDDREAYVAAHRRALRGEPATLLFRIVGLRGTERWMETHASPLSLGGETTAVLSITRDVTERKRLEEQLLHVQKMDALGRLAGGVAHDFSNALTVIIGFTELAETRLQSGEPIRDELVEVKRAAGRASELVRRLLAFSRRQVLRPRALDMNQAIANLARMVARLIGQEIVLTLDLAPDAPPVHIDEGQFEQALVNLAINARDAMPEGGRLTIATRRATTRPEDLGDYPRDHPWLVVSVSDTGGGMDAGTRARLFEPFFTTKPPGEGTGLGLSIVYGIVRQSGGRITVRSEPDRGTVFRIWLPSAPASGESS
jgi:PAS domain S-box-containing protein